MCLYLASSITGILFLLYILFILW